LSASRNLYGLVLDFPKKTVDKVDIFATWLPSQTEVAMKPNKNIMVVTVQWLDTNKCFLLGFDEVAIVLCTYTSYCFADRCHVSTMGKN